MSSQTFKKQNNSLDVWINKEKTNSFLFATSKAFKEQLKPCCSFYQGQLLEEGGHSYCQYVVKQMGKNITKEKRKEVGSIINDKKLCFEA